jgi:Co/Zn/Cd efflux system component
MTKITSAKQLAEAGVTANPTAQGVVAIAALLVNVICICVIMKRAKAAHKNPYTNEIFVGTKDYEEAMARKEA